MKFPIASKEGVSNRGTAPVSFLTELVQWGKSADESIFAPNARFEIYSKVNPELGPFVRPLQRRAVMLEVMRVLAGFESSWDWTEGVDTSRLGKDTPENAEAGAWQVSYNARNVNPEMMHVILRFSGAREILINSGAVFQRITKEYHTFAMEFVSTLMRYNTKHNGPLYKGDERLAIRSSLRGPQNSIYPWLRKSCVAEFESLLA